MNLIAYRSSVVTRDTFEAMSRLEVAAKNEGSSTIEYEGVHRSSCSWRGVEEEPGPTELPPPFSMRLTGREVYLRLSGVDDPLRGLALLWSLAVPLGFMPWDRYPLPSPTSHVFHYLGPWASVGDFLHGEGRGHLSWPSMCVAAQCEAGTWEGDRLSERSVQTHLHRLGIHCGPVDGQIGPLTLSSLKALGLGGMGLADASEALARMKVPKPPAKDRHRGHVVLNDVSMEAFSSGGVHTVRTRNGYSLTVDGPGRLVLMVGD